MKIENMLQRFSCISLFKPHRHEQYFRRNCILLRVIPNGEGEITDNIAIKIAYELMLLTGPTE